MATRQTVGESSSSNRHPEIDREPGDLGGAVRRQADCVLPEDLQLVGEAFGVVLPGGEKGDPRCVDECRPREVGIGDASKALDRRFEVGPGRPPVAPGERDPGTGEQNRMVERVRLAGPPEERLRTSERIVPVALLVGVPGRRRVEPAERRQHPVAAEHFRLDLVTNRQRGRQALDAPDQVDLVVERPVDGHRGVDRARTLERALENLDRALRPDVAARSADRHQRVDRHLLEPGRFGEVDRTLADHDRLLVVAAEHEVTGTLGQRAGEALIRSAALGERNRALAVARGGLPVTCVPRDHRQRRLGVGGTRVIAGGLVCNERLGCP